MRRQRNALSDSRQAAAGQNIARQLMRLNSVRYCQRFAGYFANDGEISLMPVINHLLQFNKQCYMPVLDTLSRNHLWFAPYNRDMPLKTNAYGIPEPFIAAPHYLRARELDVLLLPLVAFDVAGNRLGMGGGYYDRTLAFIKNRSCWRRPRLIGVAHELQRVAALPCESWDIPLHAVVTDQAIYTF